MCPTNMILLYFFTITDSVQAITQFCETRGDILNPLQQNVMVTLSESDINTIQAILDDSTDDEDEILAISFLH